MAEYHDKEWGRVVRDSRELWETLMLEGFQAGLSWQIVLRKEKASVRHSTTSILIRLRR